MLGDSVQDSYSEVSVATSAGPASGAVPVVEDQLATKISVTSALLDRHGNPIALDPEKWSHTDMWDAVLCPTVLVSRKELLMYVAERLNTTRNQAGMHLVARCQWTIGRHVTVTTASGIRVHYWGTGTYGHQSTGKHKKWSTWVEVEGYEEAAGKSKRKTSRLAFVVCAMQLQNIKDTMGVSLDKNLREVKGAAGKDTVTFLLVRYAQPHPSANKRGPEHRPLCPGPLEHTHCLWTWATRPRGYKRGCFRPRPWERNKRYFGTTAAELDKLKQRDELAWYDIIQVTNIRRYANVHEDRDADHPVFLQSLLWC